MKYLLDHPIENKRVILRTDYNVSFTPHHTIVDDNRIRSSLPTILNLLSGNNKIIIVSHLGRPKGIETKLSLEPVRKKLQEYLPSYEIKIVSDFKKNHDVFLNQTKQEILLLENIRFYPEEEKNDDKFAKELSTLGDIYVNDAFSVDHRSAASIVGITKYLPSYAGISLQQEFTHLSALLAHPHHPFVALVGGGKISTKLTLLRSLLEKVDTLLIGGGLATTCLQAKGITIGKSVSEVSLLTQAKELLSFSSKKMVLPIDVIVEKEDGTSTTRIVNDIQSSEIIRDIGPQTIMLFEQFLKNAETILWNGPVGYFETSPFNKGTEEIYKAISKNSAAVKIVGGGDSLAALSKFNDFEKNFSHVSTGGGAMLEFLEKGSLPGIEALNQT